jgi:formylglycine-generating enzyme required for sulfatase activity
MTAYRDLEYTFDSDLGLKDMLAKLHEAGPWRWVDRDNDRYGFYISASALPRPQKAMIKILVDDEIDRFVVTVSIAADEEATAEEIERTLFDRLLPAICARDLRKVDAVVPASTPSVAAAVVSKPEWLEVPAGEHEIGLLDSEARALAELVAKRSREHIAADPDQLHGLREQWYLEQQWGNADYLYAQLAHSMPAHRVTLPSCAIASRPVTVAEYEQFRAATGAAAPTIFRGNLPAPTDPVIGIAWTEASAFAAWAGAELPLEAAWEVALRPPSRSPFGAIGHDLYEWCADEFGPYPGADRIAFGRIAPPRGGWFGTRTTRGGVNHGLPVTVIGRSGCYPTLRLLNTTFRLMRRNA